MAIVFTATLPLAAFVSIRIVAEANLQREILQTNLLGAARAGAMHADGELTASRAALVGLAESDTLRRGDVALFERQLRSRQALRPGWERLALLDASGRLLFEVDDLKVPQAMPTSTAEIDLLGHAWSRSPSQGVLLALPSVKKDEGAESARQGIWIGVTTTAGGGRRYLLAARVGLDVWRRLLNGVAPGADGYAALFDERHRMVVRTLAPGSSAGQPIPAVAPAGMTTLTSGVQKTGQPGDGETYFAWQGFGNGGWAAGVVVPVAGLDAMQVRRTLRFFGIAVACLWVGVAWSGWAARFVVIPWQRLPTSDDNALDPPIHAAKTTPLREASQGSPRHQENATTGKRFARDPAEASGHTRDSWLGMLGHELRNPLNGIVTAAEVLRAADGGSKMADSARAVLTRQVRKLTRMVDDLSDFGQVVGRQAPLTMRPVELRELFGRSVQAALPLACDKTLRLRLEAAAPVWIDADASRIEQVMARLLDHAIGQTPGAGEITVRLAVVDGLATVSVDDGGAGIDADRLGRMFEPFMPGESGLDPSTGDLGLGLALVERIVEWHGGSVFALSSPQGNSLGWRLPETPAPVESTEAASPLTGR